MDSNETLFSLELAVETLRIHSSTVVCRLPSLAFRLLDFPTLLLHHVDPEEVRNIKEKINLGSFGNIPAQLHELKDHRGNFCVNKCKSCLLKMNPETLLAYLRNTPLYIMLIDVWPDVSKLVANCTISLQQTMEEISQDIEQNGIDIPSVHGHRDSYKLYNLMGSEVGWVVLRYRLLSMGVSLLPHIPDTAITRRQKERIDLAVTPRKTTHDNSTEDVKTKSKEKEDIVLEDLEVEGHPKKTISIALSAVDHSLDFQMEKANQRDQKGTQTAQTTKRRHNQHKVERSMPLMQNDDLFVNNTLCPPPLYFNTVNEDSPITSGINIQTLGRNHREMRGCLNTNNDGESQVAYNLSEDLSTMSSGTCSEEVIHEVETHYILPSENTALSPRWSVRKTHRKLKTENSQTIETTNKKHRGDQQHRKRERQNQGSETCNRCQLHLDPRHQSQLPILAALLQELSLLHGNVLQNEPISREIIQQPTPRGKHKPQVEVVATPKGKENILISKPQSIVHEEKPYRHKHQECTKPPQGVPRTKGWLRQQPVHSKRKTKLHYGMTHSQKLRLKKNNPELLKELEVEEVRLRTLQMENEKMTMRDEDDFMDEVGNLNVSTEIAHHLEDEKKADYNAARTEPVSKAEQTKSSSKKVKHKQMKDHHIYTDVSDRKGRTIEPVMDPQPPTPRPRKLTEGTFVWGDKDSRVETDSKAGEFPDAQFSSVEPKDLSSSDKSARSIDVYLPTASLQESDIDSHSDDSNDTDYSSSRLIQRSPKTIQVPGIPPEDTNQLDTSHAEEVPNVQYSDDFIDSDRFTSTGEQELGPLSSNKSYDSVHSSFSSSSSRSSSKSRISQVALNPPTSSMPLSSDVATNLQRRRLSIPKPKLSSISPVPVRRTSKTSTLSVNTATTLDPHKDADRSPTPPTPRPRPSLMRSSSLFSEDSRLLSTVPSSEFKTEDSQNADWTNKDESEDNYTDDFSDSDHESDQSNQF